MPQPRLTLRACESFGQMATHLPHPEERSEAECLEGWQPAPRVLPPFETLAALAPQGEVVMVVALVPVRDLRCAIARSGRSVVKTSTFNASSRAIASASLQAQPPMPRLAARTVATISAVSMFWRR